MNPENYHMLLVEIKEERNTWEDFPLGSVVKKSTCIAGDAGLMSGLGRSPREGSGNPLQYSCLANPIERGSWRAWGCKRARPNLGNEHTEHAVLADQERHCC